MNEKNKAIFQSDDSMASMSKLEVSICEVLENIDFNHTILNGFGKDKFSLDVGQVKKLIKFLQDGVSYLESNNNPVLKPEGFDEFEK